MAPIYQDFDQLYGHLAPEAQAAVELDKKLPGSVGKMHHKQFQNIDALPYDAGIEMNLLSLCINRIPGQNLPVRQTMTRLTIVILATTR